MENDLDASSRSSHTPSLSETSLFTCSSVRMPTTTSFTPESGSPADSLVTENSESLQGTKVLINRAITTENDLCERLIQLVANQFTQAKLGGTVGEKAALFTDTLLRSAEELTPCPICRSRLSGLFKDKAMRTEFEEAWTKREKTRTVVRGAFAGG